MAQPVLEPHVDFATVTANQQRVWAAGDFSAIARSIVPVSEALVSAVDPHAGQRVLDVACGSGNTALVAARRYCQVTGLDYVPALLERAARRAAAEDLEIRWVSGDAQALPFDDRTFDCVMSTFGVMFAPDQETAARELTRVCRPGGSIGLASWTPEGGVGDFFRTVVKYGPPPPPLPPPMRWGTDAGLRELFGPRARIVRSERRLVTEYFLSVEHAVGLFRTYFGPTLRVFESLDPEGQRAFTADLTALFSRENRATDGTLIMPLEYLETVLIVG